MKTQILKALVIVASGLFMVSCDSGGGGTVFTGDYTDREVVGEELPGDPNEEAEKMDSIYSDSVYNRVIEFEN